MYTHTESNTYYLVATWELENVLSYEYGVTMQTATKAQLKAAVARCFTKRAKAA